MDLPDIQGIQDSHDVECQPVDRDVRAAGCTRPMASAIGPQYTPALRQECRNLRIPHRTIGED